jgi:tetratricopeptide (TPR) repeat protein
MVVDLRSKRSPLFKVPYPPNPYFTGRTELLTTIHNNLVLNKRSDCTTSYALHGLGGVGKTQIAIRYAYLHKTYFDVICWLRAHDWNTLVTSYVELSRDPDFTAVGAPTFEDGLDNAVIAERMKMWFERESTLKWFLIFDNADRIDDPYESPSVIELIPRGEYGCVLTTSRNRASNGELASAGCEVEEMMESEAIQFCLKCSRKQKSESVEQEAKILVKMLGCLPLAIEQAGSYVRTKGVSLSRYISLYETNTSRALEQPLPKSHTQHYQHTVAKTWKISFDEVSNRDPLASEILRLMAFLDGTRIQKELFEVGGKNLTNQWKLSKATTWTIEEALGCLQSYSLVRPLESNDVSIHLLVQQVIRKHVNLSEQDFSNAALQLVGSQFPRGGDLENIGQCLKYVSHAKVCVQNDSLGGYSDELVQLMGSLGAFFESNGEYNLAIDQYKQALRIKETEFGGDHIKIVNTINNLGSVYNSQGKYDLAIDQYKQALRINEEATGVDHIDMAATINNLGNTYNCQGKYDLAIDQYKHALRIYEKKFGVDHISTANTINNLGAMYHRQGQYDLAIDQLKRALTIKEMAFGVDHINMVDTINNLGGAYNSQGKYDLAIDQYKRALWVNEKAFGVNSHITIASIIHNLGNTYHSQGKYDLAIDQLKRALTIKEKAFGVDHINMADTINNLGRTYNSQCKYDLAIEQYERALSIYEKAFGVDHINTTDTIMNVGPVRKSQGQVQTAERQFVRGHDIFQSNWGSLHPASLNARYILENHRAECERMVRSEFIF